MTPSPSVAASGTQGRPVMAIGLDGLTLEILQPLVAAGELPTFASLMGKGSWGPLRSVTNMLTGPTWASFATGCEPRRHGVLNDYHHRRASYSLRQTTGADVKQPTLWELASKSGRRSIVINVPHTYPARPFDGVLLAGIDAPGREAPGFDHPPGTLKSMSREVGDYVIDCGFQSYVGAAGPRADDKFLADGIAAVERETESRTRAAEWLMSGYDWDLFVVVYSLPDIWQHFFWPECRAATDAQGEPRIRHGYRILDGCLARLLAALPPEGIAIVFSDHGFGPATGSLQGLNRRLASHGLLRFRDSKREQLLSRVFAAMLGLARRRLGYRARQRLLGNIPHLKQAVDSRLKIGAIDWSRTYCYGAIDHSEVWVNLRGRQPNGIVEPSDHNEVCRRVELALLSWRDERTGLPRATAVRPHPDAEASIEDCIPPDLLVEWCPEAAPAGAHPRMSGDHAPDGVICVSGDGIPGGELKGLSLVDVAPTVLAALGDAIPEWMDGEVPPALAGAIGVPR